ncbi:MAG: class I SAM-dependent methyltransferase family protein [Candidatus Woesearchaeota archaeon]
MLSKSASQTKLASFEIVGTIAIVEIPRGFGKYAKTIAKRLMLQNPRITTVVKKIGGRRGTFRLQKVRILAGRRTTLTEAKESGLRMLVDVAKVYFSPRLANERLRIARAVKPGEHVLVMFSGVAPYPLVIARYSRAERVYGIEINPVAHALAVQNVALNKLGHKIVLFKGDVRKIIPQLWRKFDRIVMPLPKTGKGFLNLALLVAKKGATIHYYTFAHENELSAVAGDVEKVCASLKKRCKILQIVRAGQHSPRVWRICVDFKVY